MGSKSGDWYKELREQDPTGYRELMDKKYANRLGQLNTDPDKFAQMKFTKQRSGAKERKLQWDLTKEQVHKMIKETTHCQVSGRKVMLEVGHPDGASIDRIDSTRGYTIDNVQITSQLINKARGEMTVDEFVKMCRDVVEFHDAV